MMRFVVVACGMAMSWGWAAQPADAGWSASVTLRAASRSIDASVTNPRATVSAQGRGLAAWFASRGTTRRTTLDAACDDWNQRPTRTRTVATRHVISGVVGPATASDGDGDEVVAWAQTDGLYAAVRSRDSACLTRPRRVVKLTMQASGSGDVQAVGTGRDNFVFLLRDNGSVLAVATHDDARAAGGLDDLGRGTLYVSRSNGDELRSDARGDAVLVWSEAGSPQRLAVSVRPSGGAFGAPQSLPDAGAADPSLAVDAAGDYAVAWTDTTRSGELTNYGVPSVAIGTQRTPLGLPIRAPAAEGGDSYAPQAAFLGSLGLAVLW
jgi:hypothetical protein